ncbi:rhodanese-like domain-containing protein [Porphyromonas sp.]|uniref:rhodanese-like domain-containing protein n=1 Tax=Porphyromonas sp. TaxID=1924944 RepID=UPI0026DDAA07|nr:rhodanese-like domain-containing protein [Porphyromonas sp.]MDO4771456.1 rhodanese-like domain-containing protein [Porphyromonas sp.]
MNSIFGKLFGSSASLSMQEIYDLVHRDGAILLDVRTEDEYRKGKVGNSINIPINDLEIRLSELPKDRPLIVYCASGGRSTIACQLLKEKGFDKIYNAKVWEEVSAALDRRK